jgi:hypothetical protein
MHKALARLTLALAIAFAGVAQGEGLNPPTPLTPTEHAIADAIGVFCVPVLIAGRLPSQDLIKASQFTPGTQPHPEHLSQPSFTYKVSNGDIVEVFADERAHACIIHVHGAASAIDDYRAALRAQNWQQALAPLPAKSGGFQEGWRVNFDAPAGRAVQLVITAPAGMTDPTKPQVTAIFIHAP